MNELLDIERLVPKLDGLVGHARASYGAGGDELLSQARKLLVKLREAPAATPTAGASGVDPANMAGWHAIAEREHPEEGDVTCWHGGGDGEASLHGIWRGGRLQLVQIRVGDQAWGMRMTSAGASKVSTGEPLEGAADRRMSERFARRARVERERLGRERAAATWSCERCSWVNRADTKVCALCGVVEVPGEAQPFDDLLAEVTPVGDLHELAAPAGYEGVFPELLGRLTLNALDQPAGEVGGIVVTGDIVVDGFDPDRAADVAQAVHDVRELAGAVPDTPAHATELLQHLPAIVCSDVPSEQAAAIRRILDRAGASSRFERRHG